jgi:DNA mismatch endonuclease, patch repair protein
MHPTVSGGVIILAGGLPRWPVRLTGSRPTGARLTTLGCPRGWRRSTLWRVAEYPHPSSQGRAANMRAIRRTDTKPEVALRRALHRQGYRFRKDYRLDLADGRRVRPDIAFTARRVAVFVDGCFWHACPEHGGKPANNVWYWEPKLRRNVERDRAADAALSAAGWNVVRVWEHEPLEAAVAAVLAALAKEQRVS